MLSQKGVYETDLLVDDFHKFSRAEENGVGAWVHVLLDVAGEHLLLDICGRNSYSWTLSPKLDRGPGSKHFQGEALEHGSLKLQAYLLAIYTVQVVYDTSQNSVYIRS